MPTTSTKRGAPSSSSSSEVVDDVQPLRDLAKNFDIDIEPYLQEYLASTYDRPERDDADADGGGGEGGGEGGTMDGDDGGGTARNFAAAALKIQNSVGM